MREIDTEKWLSELFGELIYRGIDLHGANLSGADLHGAYLSGAKFTVELKDAVNLHPTAYDPHQFPFLALNLSFQLHTKEV